MTISSSQGRIKSDQVQQAGSEAARRIVPNVMTLLALGFGIQAVRLSFEARFEWAVVCLLIAAVLDGFDGRVARALGGGSRFGAELDSLADLVNFGVAPALLVYLWGLAPLGVWGWAGALIFALCTALRLARFNVGLDDDAKPARSADFFEGVPAPAGAFLALLPVYLHEIGLIDPATAAPWALGYLVTVAGLMVSRLPTFSAKAVRLRRSRALALLAALAAIGLTMAVASYPWHVLSAFGLAYLASLPVSRWRHGAMG